jgi:hypothetical protein
LLWGDFATVALFADEISDAHRLERPSLSNL